MVANSGILSANERAELNEQLGKTFSSQVSTVAKEGIREMVRAMLPEVAERMVKEEIQRIHAQEQSVEIDSAALTAAVQEAFAPQVESVAREMVAGMVAEMLPQLAEKMVVAEIEKIKNGD